MSRRRSALSRVVFGRARQPGPEDHQTWSLRWWQAIAEAVDRGERPPEPMEANPYFLRAWHEQDPDTVHRRVQQIAGWLEFPRTAADLQQVLAEWQRTGTSAHEGRGHGVSATTASAGNTLVATCQDCGVPLCTRLEWRSELGYPPEWLPAEWAPIWQVKQQTREVSEP